MPHVRVDDQLKARAADAFASVGLTLSDAVRILLIRVATEGGLPAGFAADPDTYDAWFRVKVHEALDDPRPLIPMPRRCRRSRHGSMQSVVPDLEWRATAVADLAAIGDHVANDDPDAAKALKHEIEEKASRLTDNTCGSTGSAGSTARARWSCGRTTSWSMLATRRR